MALTTKARNVLRSGLASGSISKEIGDTVDGSTTAIAGFQATTGTGGTIGQVPIAGMTATGRVQVAGAEAGSLPAYVIAGVGLITVYVAAGTGLDTKKVNVLVQSLS